MILKNLYSQYNTNCFIAIQKRTIFWKTSTFFETNLQFKIKSKLNYAQNQFGANKACYSNKTMEKLTESATNLQLSINDKYANLYSKYEVFVGLKEVRLAQDKVKQAEENFLKARDRERDVMKEMHSVRDQLKVVRERLSIINYSNPLYPQLANELHELVTKEEEIKVTFDLVEERERDTFLVLSATMRDSYEKERARVERTKNWSLIGSVVGTILGMLGSVYINQVRTKDLKVMINKKDYHTELQQEIEDIKPFVQTRYDDVKEAITNLQVCLANNFMLDPSENMNKSEEIKSPQNSDVLKRALDVFIKQAKVLTTENSHNHDIVQKQYEHIIAQLVVIQRSLEINNSTDTSQVNLNTEGIKSSLKPNLDSLIADKTISGDIDSDVFELKAYPSQINTRYIVISGTILSALYYIFAM